MLNSEDIYNSVDKAIQVPTNFSEVSEDGELVIFDKLLPPQSQSAVRRSRLTASRIGNVALVGDLATPDYSKYEVRQVTTIWLFFIQMGGPVIHYTAKFQATMTQVGSLMEWLLGATTK